MSIIIMKGKKQSKWIGSIKCKENHNFSWIKRRCSEFSRISLRYQRVPSFIHRFVVLYAVCLEVHTNRCQRFYFFSSFPFIFYWRGFSFLVYTVYMSYPLFQFLVVFRLIPFVHYHPVGLCRSCNRLQYTHKVVWRDCRAVDSLFHCEKGVLNFECHNESTLQRSQMLVPRKFSFLWKLLILIRFYYDFGNSINHSLPRTMPMLFIYSWMIFVSDFFLISAFIPVANNFLFLSFVYGLPFFINLMKK